jgi:hypothetical protein
MVVVVGHPVTASPALMVVVVGHPVTTASALMVVVVGRSVISWSALTAVVALLLQGMDEMVSRKDMYEKAYMWQLVHDCQRDIDNLQQEADAIPEKLQQVNTIIDQLHVALSACAPKEASLVSIRLLQA